LGLISLAVVTDLF